MSRPDDPRDVLSEESQRIGGGAAFSMDAAAGRAVADAVRTTLGPRGMDKMLIDEEGKFVVTNDGVTVIEQMALEHPAANLVAEAAETQEAEVGDGTTTAVVLAGELLGEAEELLGQGLHPRTVIEGFREGAIRAREAIDEVARAVDDDLRRGVASTALTGKGDEGARTHLTDLVTEAVERVRDPGEGFDPDDVAVEAIAGGTVRDSELIDGFAIGRKPMNPSIPTQLEGELRIALVGDDVDAESTRSEAEIVVSSPEELEGFYEREAEDREERLERLLELDPDAVFVGGDVAEELYQAFVREGVLVLEQVPREELDAVANVTGGSVEDLDSLAEADLGRAGRIDQRHTGYSSHLVIEDVPDGRSATFFVRGGTERVVRELERAVEDAFRAIEAIEADGRVVPGGGGAEVALALAVRSFAESVEGREQLAVEAFADALEAIPKTLASTSGQDPIDALVELRSAHADGDATAGIDALESEVADVLERGIVEPTGVKRQVVDSATEAAMLVLRIDEIVVAGDLAGALVEEEERGQTEDEIVQQNEEFIDNFEPD